MTLTPLAWALLVYLDKGLSKTSKVDIQSFACAFFVRIYLKGKNHNNNSK